MDKKTVVVPSIIALIGTIVLGGLYHCKIISDWETLLGIGGVMFYYEIRTRIWRKIFFGE